MKSKANAATAGIRANPMVIGPSTIVAKSKTETTKRTRAPPKKPKVAAQDREISVFCFSIVNLFSIVVRRVGHAITSSSPIRQDVEKHFIRISRRFTLIWFDVFSALSLRISAPRR
jgi:hypothetical protein